MILASAHAETWAGCYRYHVMGRLCTPSGGRQSSLPRQVFTSAPSLHIRASFALFALIGLNGSRCAKSGKLVPGTSVPVVARGPAPKRPNAATAGQELQREIWLYRKTWLYRQIWRHAKILPRKSWVRCFGSCLGILVPC